MKHKRITRMLTGLIAALIMMGGFSVTAYAGGGDNNSEAVESVPPEESETDTSGVYVPEPLTPEGNMTLVDDIDGEAFGDKQFITVVTQNGNYFYIIIDRAAEGENTVHFLNQVDETDLLTLMEDGTAVVHEVPASCICTDKCEAGEVNMNCPVCKNDMVSCMGTEAAEPEPEPEPEESGGMGGMLVIVLILALGGGGAFYYFKVLKPKQSVKGGGNLDDFDFDDDEDEESELLEDEPEREDTE